MTLLSKTRLGKIHQQLIALQAELSAQYESGLPASDTVVLDQSKVGRLSRIDALQQQNMAQSTLRNVESRLRRVNRALAKIDSGDFGYCDECGENIELARLDVQPEAPCCFACQSKQEYHPQS
jgi:DnaK suppressor protein